MVAMESTHIIWNYHFVILMGMLWCNINSEFISKCVTEGRKQKENMGSFNASIAVLNVARSLSGGRSCTTCHLPLSL